MVNAGSFNHLHHGFVDDDAGLDDHVSAQRIGDVFSRGPARNPIAQRLDHLTTVDHRAHAQAAFGAAIDLGDDAILRDVDQTPGQVTRVGRLERGIRQTLPGAVGRVEVLEHGRAFLKFEMIGVSMISPDGLAIRPRMPASCLI